MATDKSEPRIGLIVQVAILAIVTLVAVHQALVSYFDRVAQAEEYRKVGSSKPEALLNMRADERQRLNAGAMPIEKAMEQIETRGRTGASPDIMPSASKDLAPLQGWVKMPGEVPPAMTATAVPPPPALAGDAGAPGPTMPPDAAAPRPGGSTPNRP